LINVFRSYRELRASPSFKLYAFQISISKYLYLDTPNTRTEHVLTSHHSQLHQQGLDKCNLALEPQVSMAEAETTLDDASKKFQEAAALALFNWGNVHMCSARKAMDGGRDPPLEEGGPPGAAIATATEAETVTKKLDEAKTRYEAALAVKPDFHDATIALAQRRYERARFLCAAAGLSGAGGPSKGNKDSDAAEAEFSGLAPTLTRCSTRCRRNPPSRSPRRRRRVRRPPRRRRRSRA